MRKKNATIEKGCVAVCRTLVLFCLVAVCFVSCGENAKKTWIVSFDTDGGSSIPVQLVKDGARIQKPEDPTRDGYTFAGWTLFDEDWSFVNNSVTENLTLKAVWTPNTYTIWFDDSIESIPVITVTFGANYALHGLNREGYTFKGYYYNDEIFPLQGDYTVPEDVHLKVRWELKEYKATFVAFGNKVGETTFTINDKTLKDVPNFIYNGFEVAWDYKLEYRDITITSDTVYFGSYEQDNTTAQAERIEWYILDSKDGNALLLSKKGLDNVKYRDTWIPTTWETSDSRKWLNDTFYSMAFSSVEKDRIVLTNVSADKSPLTDVDPGKDTSDKVFLLSASEVQRYLINDGRLYCPVTEYAASHGAHKSYGTGYGWWLTRTPGRNQQYVIAVFDTGDLYGLNEVSSQFNVLRPAVWVKNN